MKKNLVLQLKVLLYSSFLLITSNSFAESPAIGTWEEWLENLKNGKKSTRPDKRSLEDPLPLWVDCHLSWYFDKKKIVINKDIILISQPAQCRGQLEEWTPNK